MTVKIARVGERAGEPLPLPHYQTDHAAGVDLYADLEAPLELPSLGRVRVPTGIAIELPDGYEAQVRPRSGLAHRHGITLTNAPGTIDADYRGEIQVLLVNVSSEPYTLQRGDRIAQLVVAPVTRVDWDRVEALEGTLRGAGGFGHTGR